MYGYTFEDVPDFNVNLKNCVIRVHDTVTRSVPMVRSLECGVVGAIPYISETRDAAASLLGASKRFLAAQPTPLPAALDDFLKFVDEDIKDWPELTNADLSVEHWLANSNLPETKKSKIRLANVYYLENKGDLDYACSIFVQVRRFKYLRRILDDRSESHVYDIFVKFNVILGFTKDEFMPKLKPCRGINSRSNGMKSILGPAIHAIEDWVFNNVPEFIKRTPMNKRAAQIKLLDRPGAHTGAGDFTTYESSIRPELINVCESRLYHHMIKDQNFLMWIECISAEQHIIGRGCDIFMDAARMSGEMNTSIGNGFTTRELLRYAFHKQGCLEPLLRVEGDDSIFSYFGPRLDTRLFTDLGFTMVLKEAPLNELSFCGMVFDTTTEIIITDPFYVMASCGMSSTAVGASQQTVHTLTASKGLNMMFQYAGCPILPQLGQRFYRTACANAKMTDEAMRESIRYYVDRSQRFNWWDKQKTVDATFFDHLRDPPSSTRELFCKLYHITPECQKCIERELDTGNGWLHSEIMNTLYTVSFHEDAPTSTWIENWNHAFVATSTPVRRCNRIVNRDVAKQFKHKRNKNTGNAHTSCDVRRLWDSDADNVASPFTTPAWCP